MTRPLWKVTQSGWWPAHTDSLRKAYAVHVGNARRRYRLLPWLGQYADVWMDEGNGWQLYDRIDLGRTT